MYRVWKYPIPKLSSVVTLEMPRGAHVLSVAIQHGVVTLWARVGDGTAGTEQRNFRVCGTGHEVPADVGRFIGTVLTEDGGLVWHIWEC